MSKCQLIANPIPLCLSKLQIGTIDHLQTQSVSVFIEFENGNHVYIKDVAVTNTDEIIIDFEYSEFGEYFVLQVIKHEFFVPEYEPFQIDGKTISGPITIPAKFVNKTTFKTNPFKLSLQE